MLRLYLESPFAACRTFTAGWYRPTAAFLTPSAAYGLLLNVAGIESRVYEHDAAHDGRVPATLTRSELPRCRVAVGVPNEAPLPRVQSLFQQLHNYPVGRDAGLPPEIAMGNKNNIAPVRREVLVGLRAVVAVDGNDDLQDRIVRGLRGEFNAGRYGLPFVGDNNFLPSRLHVAADNAAVKWYLHVDADTGGPRDGTTRLTTAVDRADMSRTRSALFAPAAVATPDVPASAWADVGPGE